MMNLCYVFNGVLPQPKAAVFLTFTLTKPWAYITITLYNKGD